MDKSLLLAINQGWAAPWLDPFFIWLSDKVTFSVPLMLIILVVSVRAFGRDGLRFWLLLLAVILCGDLLGNVLKHIANQPRPCFDLADSVRLPWQHQGDPCHGNRAGMPSNHALNFFATAVFIMAVTGVRFSSLCLLVIAFLVGLSRIYLAKHYPSQVLAGAVIGSMYGYLAAWSGIKYLQFIKRIHELRPSRQNRNTNHHDGSD